MKKLFLAVTTAIILIACGSTKPPVFPTCPEGQTIATITYVIWLESNGYGYDGVTEGQCVVLREEYLNIE